MNQAHPLPPVFRRRAFTLVELLVVIGIIAILTAVLMPALRRARESANAVVCSSNQRQIMLAFLMFAADHKNHLPGNWWDHQNVDTDKRAWLINAYQPFNEAPQGGTIYKYLNHKDVYRCPSVVETFVGAGNGSNGRFDYAAFLVFSGAKVTNVKPMSRHSYNGVIDVVPTPIVCEEEQEGGINGGNNEGGHCSTDRIAHTHPNSGRRKVNGVDVPNGGGYYATIDGSVHFYKQPLQANAVNWTSQAPSGSWESLGPVPIPSWNYWNTR